MCFDGSTCDMVRDGYQCCHGEYKQGRLKCPKDAPIMCGKKNECVGNTDYCCETSVDRCSTKTERPCAPLLTNTLPEWVGIIPEERRDYYWYVYNYLSTDSTTPPMVLTKVTTRPPEVQRLGYVEYFVVI